jgi:hypothetical protein
MLKIDKIPGVSHQLQKPFCERIAVKISSY